MDPNNQNSQDGAAAPTQPAAPAQPVAPAPQPAPQPATPPPQPAPAQPAAPTTPAASAQPKQPAQPVAQPAASAQPEQPAKKKMSGGVIALIITLAVLLIGGGIFAALVLTGVINFGGGDGLFSNPTPTPELARSVCEKHGGRPSGSDKPYGDYAAVVDCDNSEASENIFAYEVVFIKDEKVEEYWRKLKDSLEQSNYEALENSDTYMKMHTTDTMGGVTMHNFAAVYKNATVELQVVDGNLGEQLLVELGFPDRSRGGPYEQADENAQLGLKLEQYNTEHRANMATLETNLMEYQANNMGQLPEISNNSLVGFDGYLEDSFNDPKTENKYTVVAYNSLADSPYATDQSGLGSAPSDEMYVFYKTSCDGGALVNKDRERSFAIVHSSETDDSIICMSSD